MSVNPLFGVLLDNKFYDYLPGSFRISVDLGKDSVVTQTRTNASRVLQSRPDVYTITLILSSNYDVVHGTSLVGNTDWLGISRLDDLQTVLGGVGTSMPIPFITPYGLTTSVVPTGALDISPFLPENPQQQSMEYRVSLTLEDIQHRT